MATRKKTSKDMFMAVYNEDRVIDQACEDTMDLDCWTGTLNATVSAAKNQLENPVDGDAEPDDSVVIFKLVPVKIVKRTAILVEDV